VFSSNKKLFSIFLIVFIDLLGFSIILPLLPFYATTFGANAVTTEALVAIYALMQFISAPILGRLSDRLGRRFVLLVSLAGNIVAYIILGFANTLLVIFIARAMAGFFGGNISVAQAYITDITDEKNRAKGLGLIGAAFGLGFIFGPALGGILSQFGFMVPALVAAGLAIINLVLVFFWLPESLTKEKRDAMLERNNQIPFTIPALIAVLRRPHVGPLLSTRFFFAIAFSMFTSVFALYGLYKFKLNAQTTGYVLAYVGVLSVIVQGFLIGLLTARFKEAILIFWSIAIMSVSLLGWALAPSLPVLIIILIPIAFAGGVFNTVINSSISKSVHPDEVGGMLGIGASLESMTRVISPILGGILLQQFGAGAPGIFCAIVTGLLAIYLWRTGERPIDVAVPA
jgi:DHA1 family tetracycline resistance protein-like MFS transporter